MSHHIQCLEGRQLFAGGTLDTTYGTAGTGVTTVAFKVGHGDSLTTRSIVVDSTGRSYVMATTRSGSVQVRRLTADGKIDTTWAAGKKNLLAFPVKNIAGATIAVDHSDRLDVLAGGQIFRFTTAGSADASFGTNGTLSLTNFADVTDFAVDATNKLWVTGAVNAGPKTHRHSVYQVARYRSVGKIDPTFQDAGRYVRVPTPARSATEIDGSAANKVGVLADGSVVVVGQNNADVVSTPDDYGSSSSLTYGVKFTPAGAIDTSYGKAGVSSTVQGRTYDDGYTFVTPTAIRPDGSVVTYIDAATQTIGDPQETTGNIVIAANGKSASNAYFGQTRDPDADYTGVQADAFVTRPGGGTLISTTGGAIDPLRADGSYDTTFAVRLTQPYFADIATQRASRVLAFGNVPSSTDTRVVRFFADT